MSRAVHRTILVVDVAGFGDLRRTNLHQVAVHGGLYRVLTRAFAAAGIPWNVCEDEDRGDGALVLIPPGVPKSLLVEALPGALLDSLREHNRAHRAEEQIRLRMALHAGEIHYDEHGVVGRPVNLTFRLLELPVLKRALADSGGLLAVVTSAWFYDEVVWHSRERDDYHQVRAKAKETDTTAWISVPGMVLSPELLAPIAEESAPHQLPAGIRQFVGRESELGRLDTISGAAGAVIITAIDGTAGIGKTTLAMHWAHQVKDRFPDGQLHVNLRGFDPNEPMDPGQALHGFLQALEVAPGSIPADLEPRAALYRSLLAERRMLIVLDNARSADQVRPLLPGTPTCLVVVTSRNQLRGLMVREGAYRIALDVLPAEDARALLAERIDGDRLAAEPRAVAELMELCARLPLALSIVAARAASQANLPLAALVHELNDERHRLDALDLGETDLSVRAVFSWSYNVLSPAAARLFRLLGVHPGPDIDLLAAEALASDARQLLKELVTAHLLAEHVPGRFRFHDLLRAYAAELAATEPDRRAAAERMLDHYLNAADHADRQIQPVRPGYEEAMSWFAAEHDTLLAMVTFAADQGFAEYAWRLASACQIFLRRVGRRHERVAVHRTALAASRKAGDQHGQATALRQLAQGLSRLSRFDEAKELLDEALELSLALKDESHLLHVHLAYCRVFEAQGQHQLALDHARAGWDLARHKTGGGNKAAALTAMGRQESMLGQFTEAAEHSAKALSLYAAMPDKEGEANVLKNIGELELRLGKLSEALVSFERSLALDRELGDRYWEAHALDCIGAVHAAGGDETRAKALWRQAFAIFTELRHPDAADVRAKLSSPANGG
ncbi:ATP-binding protein [Amycolatopsis sp. NPDC059657]|uniref:ATP-binding protein n=1 Tax=Amycolatopsis sp. NPDC059657 TaxID=3346899 RepID=UPI00366F6AC1